MTFLNLTILFALSAVAIPVVIHLLNQRRAKVVHWGAMRFLLASLAARNRRIRIEEMLLLAMRCLWVALLVLALARPLLPSRPGLPWPLVLPAVLIAAVCAGLAAAVWTSRRLRWTLLATAGGLLLLAVTASAAERLMQRRLWSAADDARDLAVIIDASDSMSVAVGEQTGFDRAVNEARTLIGSLPTGDAAAVMLAGSAIESPVPAPVSDRRELLAALDSASLVGGSMDAASAISAATDALAAGGNAAKKIVVITDGQKHGWELHSDARWDYVSSGFDALRERPKVIFRDLRPPVPPTNAAVDGITLSRRIVGADRPVGIDVRIANTGVEPMDPGPVELLVGDSDIGRRRTGEIEPGSSASVRFEHHFDSPGRQVLTARLDIDDDLPADNTRHHVVDVLDVLPVLVVCGSSGADRDRTAAELASLALAPGAEDDALGSLVRPELVDATDLARVDDFSRYRAIVLAGVPRLPSAVAGRIENYVRGGGGLLIAPDRATAADFYNNWTDRRNLPVTPAELVERITPQDPARPLTDSFDHPAMRLTADQTRSDIGEANIRSYWVLSARDTAPAARTAARLSTGNPMLVERPLGRGRVFISAVSLGEADSDLPSLASYVVALHEIIAHLSEPTQAQTDVAPGEELRLTLPLMDEPSPDDVSAKAATPDGRRLKAGAAVVGGHLHLSFTPTRPGLYGLELTEEVADMLDRPAESLPFTARRDPDESRFEFLDEQDMAALARHVDLVACNSTDELTAAVAGGTPGQEIWRHILPIAGLALLAELVLSRWIATRRRMHTAETIRFGGDNVDTSEFHTPSPGRRQSTRPRVGATGRT